MEIFIINGSVQFGKLDGICQNIFTDKWVEFLNVKLNELVVLFFLFFQQHKKYKKENKKHYRLNDVFPPGTSCDIARNILLEKK